MSNKYRHPSMKDPDGEMLPLERKKLYEWVTNKKPSTVVEIGGGLGGGSTMQIMNAIIDFRDIDNIATLYTCDPIHRIIQHGFQYFSTHPDFKHQIRIVPDFGMDFIKKIKVAKLSPDFVFFDGPDNEDIVYNDFIELDPILPKGCLFASHDWETEKRLHDGATCVKNKKLRPYLEQNKDWKLVEYLEGINSKDSVGLCLWKKIND